MSEIGHNNAPDPIDATLAPYSDAIAEAANWLDGQKVENEAQMKSVDAVLKDIRAAGTALHVLLLGPPGVSGGLPALSSAARTSVPAPRADVRPAARCPVLHERLDSHAGGERAVVPG